MSMKSFLSSKLHNVRVTKCDQSYEGSICLDAGWMKRVSLRPYEQVHVWNVSSGSRIITYAIPKPAGSKAVELNGSAALHFNPGDIVIVAAFELMNAHELPWPSILIFGEDNEIMEEKHVGDVITTSIEVS